MDILHRFPVRRPAVAAAQKDQEHARMTLQEITSEVDAQARRFEEIRRLLFSRQCEQADTLSGGLRALCSAAPHPGPARPQTGGERDLVNLGNQREPLQKEPALAPSSHIQPKRTDGPDAGGVHPVFHPVFQQEARATAPPSAALGDDAADDRERDPVFTGNQVFMFSLLYMCVCVCVYTHTHIYIDICIINRSLPATCCCRPRGEAAPILRLISGR